MSDETIHTRPNNNRPRTGLAAWEATIGYIATEHSPDVMLTLKALPDGDGSTWQADLDWAENAEHIDGEATLPGALQALWKRVSEAHIIFTDRDDAFRAPVGYTEFDWLDPDTKDALDRLSWVTQVVFRTDWTLIIIYHPTDNRDKRVQMRLLAHDGDVHIAGRGPSIEDAATKLYRNATPYFSKRKD